MRLFSNFSRAGLIWFGASVCVVASWVFGVFFTKSRSELLFSLITSWAFSDHGLVVFAIGRIENKKNKKSDFLLYDILQKIQV